MFIPIKDTNPNLRKPLATYSLILVTIGVYLLQHFYRFDHFIFSKALFLENPLQAFPSLITYQFLHGSWAHLFFNMLFLYIFGDNMEGSLGRRFFLFFYLSCGVGAAISEVYLDPYFGANNPGLLIGASGSISGILAAYAIRYPRAKILTWTLFVFFFKIRAAWFIGIWIATQFLFEILTPQDTTAYIAHIGGFVMGVVIYSVYHKYRLNRGF
ncbi:MAG: rhomboid family intramembrane serine protease [Candidatus Marinimicrobia bacterium]|nr:rhomboid family intramembrane serine protease [Candidatus Neomarinimicrobiota bacterium]